jgi:hypothetical protein
MYQGGSLIDYRDRSAEFFSTVQQLKQQRAEKEPFVENPSALTRRGNALNQRSQFSQAAAHIMQGIHSTSKKLEELTILTKNTSLYNNPVEAINRITYELKQDMETLQKEIDVLNVFVASQGPHASPQDGTHSTIIVANLKDQLASQTKSFVKVLTQRTQNMKVQSTRRSHFEGLSVQRKARPHDFSSLLDAADTTAEVSEPEPSSSTQLVAFESPGQV